MKLQLLITHYNEEPLLVKRLLDSVDLQQDVNFDAIQAIIVNDGDLVPLEADVLGGHNFEVRYYHPAWSDTSGARQFALDHADGDYVMFCDCDDLLYRNTALLDVFDKIIKEQPDIIVSKFIGDNFDKDDNFQGLVPYDNDNVWIHGKVWRRQFLLDNNIKWKIELGHKFEDSYFVRQAFSCKPKKIHLDEPIWFWKHREKSLVRNNSYDERKMYQYRIISNNALIDALLEKNLEGIAAQYAYVQAYEAYFMMLTNTWDDVKAEKDAAEFGLQDFFKRYDYLIQKVPYEAQIILINTLRDRFYKKKNKLSLEEITYKDWKKKILKKKNV